MLSPLLVTRRGGEGIDEDLDRLVKQNLVRDQFLRVRVAQTGQDAVSRTI